MKLARCVLIMVGIAIMIGCATTPRSTSSGPSERARAHYEKGVRLSQEGELKKALAALKRAVKAYPGYGDAHYNMGIVYQKMNRAENAVRAYQKAIEINPEDAAAHNNLGNIYLRQNRLGEAIDELSAAVRTVPDYGLAHHNLALAYYLAGMYHKAWDHLNEMKRLGIVPEPDLMEAVGSLLNIKEGT
jgi:tetratricopeptide (TPR) repeat protein